MDYVLVLMLSIIGVLYDVMGKIRGLRRKFPQFHKGEIINTFFSEEWDSLIISGLVVATLETGLFIVRYNELNLSTWLEEWGIYFIALAVSYSGQRLAYKALGTAEKVLSDKVDKMGGN